VRKKDKGQSAKVKEQRSKGKSQSEEFTGKIFSKRIKIYILYYVEARNPSNP
jgi:hypothetical protein